MLIKASRGISASSVKDAPLLGIIQATSDNINECLEVEEKVSKAGVKYMQYTLFVEDAGTKEIKIIPYLMNAQLKNLVEQYGGDTSAWIGQGIEVGCEDNGQFTNFKIMPRGLTDIDAEQVKLT